MTAPACGPDGARHEDTEVSQRRKGVRPHPALPHFFMREFLYGEIANIHGMTNLPQDPDLVVDQRSTSWSPSPTLVPTASTRPGSATPRTLPR